MNYKVHYRKSDPLVLNQIKIARQKILNRIRKDFESIKIITFNLKFPFIHCVSISTAIPTDEFMRNHVKYIRQIQPKKSFKIEEAFWYVKRLDKLHATMLVHDCYVDDEFAEFIMEIAQ